MQDFGVEDEDHYYGFRNSVLVLLTRDRLLILPVLQRGRLTLLLSFKNSVLVQSRVPSITLCTSLVYKPGYYATVPYLIRPVISHLLTYYVQLAR